MAVILNIETATSVCSVALSVGEEVIFERASHTHNLNEGPSHASLVGVYVEESLRIMRTLGKKLDAVAISGGPGSYTGLRIGASLAKGLCFGFDIPLISIYTLDIMAYTVIRDQGSTKESSTRLYCPMIDARRMEVYAALYDSQMREIRPVVAEIVKADTYAPYLSRQEVCFFGNGAAKCQAVIPSPNAIFLENIHPLASNMAILSHRAFQNRRFEDNMAYFEPFYLKEFQATVPKNKVLGERLKKS